MKTFSDEDIMNRGSASEQEKSKADLDIDKHYTDSHLTHVLWEEADSSEQ